MGDLNFILYTLMCFVDFMLQHKCFYIQQRKMHNKILAIWGNFKNLSHISNGRITNSP